MKKALCDGQQQKALHLPPHLPTTIDWIQKKTVQKAQEKKLVNTFS